MPVQHERRGTARFVVPKAVADCRQTPMAFMRRNIADRVLDISTTGAKLLLKGAIEAGRKVQLKLDLAGKAVETLADIVWVRAIRRGDTRLLVGVHFNGMRLDHAALWRLSRQGAN